MSYLEWINTDIHRDFKAVLFDFDGTLSLIREGWQPIMYGYFTEVLTAVSGLPEAEIYNLVKDFVDLLTGEQTIYQCIRLAEEVRKHGASRKIRWCTKPSTAAACWRISPTAARLWPAALPTPKNT